MSVLIFRYLECTMSENKSKTLVEKLILFAVFLVFAGIVVAFAFKWNYVEDDTDTGDVTSFQFITSSKTDSVTENNGDSSQTISDKININTATVDELDALPGIGPSKAEAIVKYRETESRFNSPVDITNVSGIGEKTYEKIKDYITVE